MIGTSLSSRRPLSRRTPVGFSRRQRYGSTLWRHLRHAQWPAGTSPRQYLRICDEQLPLCDEPARPCSAIAGGATQKGVREMAARASRRSGRLTTLHTAGWGKPAVGSLRRWRSVCILLACELMLTMLHCCCCSRALAQSPPADAAPHPALASLYGRWYLQSMLIHARPRYRVYPGTQTSYCMYTRTHSACTLQVNKYSRCVSPAVTLSL